MVRKLVLNGRRIYPRASAQGNAAAFIQRAYRSRKANAPVSAKLAPPARRERTATGRNINAINTLAAQVKKLQMDKFGFIQTRSQYLTQTGAANAGELTLLGIPTQLAPTVFMANDFFEDSVYYRSTIVNGLSLPVVEGTWVAPQGFNSSLDDRYFFNLRNQQETVSKLQYVPLKTRLNFRFSDSMNAGDLTNTFRITIFRLKKVFENTTVRSYNLPQALAGYGGMINQYNASQRNHFNMRIHQVVHDRYVALRPKTAAGASVISRDLQLDVKFPFRELRTDLGSTPAAQNQWSNTAIDSMYWCLISSDIKVVPATMKIKVERVNVWRDTHGVNTA